MNQVIGHAARRPLAQFCSSPAASKLGPIKTMGTLASAALKAETNAGVPILAAYGAASALAAKAGPIRTLSQAAKAAAGSPILASLGPAADSVGAWQLAHVAPILAAYGPASALAAKAGPIRTLSQAAKAAAGSPTLASLGTAAASVRVWQRANAQALEAAAQHWHGQSSRLARMAPHTVGWALMFGRDLRAGLTPAQAERAGLGYTMGEAVDFLAAPDARDHETVRLAAAYLQGTLWRALLAGELIGAAALGLARLAAQGLAHAACAKLVKPTLPAALTAEPAPRPRLVRHTSKPQRLMASVILPDRAPPAALAVA